MFFSYTSAIHCFELIFVISEQSSCILLIMGIQFSLTAYSKYPFSRNQKPGIWEQRQEWTYGKGWVEAREKRKWYNYILISKGKIMFSLECMFLVSSKSVIQTLIFKSEEASFMTQFRPTALAFCFSLWHIFNYCSFVAYFKNKTYEYYSLNFLSWFFWLFQDSSLEM